MKEILLKICALSIILFSCIDCGCLKKQQKKVSNMYGYEYLFNQRQLDSICFVDNLNPNIEDWLSSTFYDYETSETIVRKMYIKTLDKENEAIYTLMEKNDTLYLITKRIVKTE